VGSHGMDHPGAILALIERAVGVDMEGDMGMWGQGRAGQGRAGLGRAGQGRARLS
jgi:hypothetical protein